MKRARLICLVAMAIMLLGFAMDTSVEARGPGGLGYGDYTSPTFFGYWGSPYSLGQIPVPPYFSLHPPVYYSVPVPRTYGYSPYAYPGWVPTPDVEIVEPEVIENPHAGEQAQIETTKTASYQIIDNPFVRAELKARLSTRYAAFDPVE